MKIMVVDTLVLRSIERVLNLERIEFKAFEKAQDAIDWICDPPKDAERPDLILTGLDLRNGYNGREIIKTAREAWPDIQAAIVTDSNGFKKVSESECRKTTPHILMVPSSFAEQMIFLARIKKDLAAKR